MSKFLTALLAAASLLAFGSTFAADKAAKDEGAKSEMAAPAETGEAAKKPAKKPAKHHAKKHVKKEEKKEAAPAEAAPAK
jgi:hypothetical protein